MKTFSMIFAVSMLALGAATSGSSDPSLTVSGPPLPWGSLYQPWEEFLVYGAEYRPDDYYVSKLRLKNPPTEEELRLETNGALPKTDA